MLPASINDRVSINKQAAGYNEALPRCSSTKETAAQFFLVLKLSAWLQRSGINALQFLPMLNSYIIRFPAFHGLYIEP